MSWLPADFAHPTRVDVCPGYHLRPIRADDTPIDYPAVMGSRESLWARYGPTWGWPSATMTEEQDRADLARHEREIAEHVSFNYALFNEDETALFGCVYLDPSDRDEAEISWWVVDELAGGEVQRAFDEFVPAWIASAWPFRGPLIHQSGDQL
ncbi:MAG TPA: GNAT family N-acetyltransferase [Pseudonocardiaceae bacterium]